MSNEQDTPLWEPSAERIDNARLTDYQRWLRANKGLEFKDYNALWQWSVDQLEDFYGSIWEYFDIQHSAPYRQVLDSHRMPGAHWFQGAQLNLVEQMLRHHHDEPERPAIMSRSETRDLQLLSWGELRSQVASVAHQLRQLGIGAGDRVVSYMPNIPETMIAFFAVASVGAIWSSCSPDMGTRSVVDRFAQIEPKLLFAVDGYRYGGVDHDRLDVVRSLRDKLPSLDTVVLLPYLDRDAALDDSVAWAACTAHDVTMLAEQVPAEHPLWVVYSSGTTGLPKPIVHGHAGALVEGLLFTAMQHDIGPADRYMWFTTTGWVMWNAQMFGLLAGATICLYDGNPGYPDLGTLWKFADETGMTVFGAGAAYYQGCRKVGIRPGALVTGNTIKTLGSTGSPLSAENYWWLARQFPQAMVAATSGGTDIANAYVGPSPTVPVHAGEMQCRFLGKAVCAMGDDGEVLDNAVGELVVDRPMPSMPLYFWNDPDGQRYYHSYFDTFPGVWRHGDWIRITPRGGAIIYGRSDTTINRQGVRMGTSEIYRVVEEFPEIVDSMVVDLEYLGRAPWMPLFVVLQEGATVTPALADRIRAAVRDNLSPRHVPNEIIQVASIPRTLSGKKMELPVKKLLLGQPLEKVASPGAMANPESMEIYQKIARDRAGAETA